MSKAYRMGAVGALLDEYERAAEDLKSLVKTIELDDFVSIADKETNDPACVSVQSIMNHVIRAGYGYANHIRKQFGDEWAERKENYDVSSSEISCIELDKMLKYTEETLSNKYGITDKEVIENVMHVPWGQDYDFEQMLEHAIVHILRHRRQIEKFKLILKKN